MENRQKCDNGRLYVTVVICYSLIEIAISRVQRSTIDMIFAVRQVQEKCREQNLDLYMVFVDLTTISRDGLWQTDTTKDWLS